MASDIPVIGAFVALTKASAKHETLRNQQVIVMGQGVGHTPQKAMYEVALFPEAGEGDEAGAQRQPTLARSREKAPAGLLS